MIEWLFLLRDLNWFLKIFFLFKKKASEKYLLGPVKHSDVNRKCLIIDLDETLVHSSFKVSHKQGSLALVINRKFKS